MDPESPTKHTCTPKQGRALSPSANEKGLSHDSSYILPEIKKMMHGFGDCRQPLHESAVLVEEVLRKQMTSVLHQAQEVAFRHKADHIGINDILFLMRNDRVKLNRILTYMMKAEFGCKLALSMYLQNDLGVSIPELKGTTPGVEEGLQALDQRNKKELNLKKFIQSIDQTGELMSLFDEDVYDEVKKERQIRADRMSRTLEGDKYLAFINARRAKLWHNKVLRSPFKDWLLGGSNEPKLTTNVLRLLGYLAYETVAQVIDLALIVRRDREATGLDPISRAMPHVFYNPVIPLNQQPETQSTGESNLDSSSRIETQMNSPTSPSQIKNDRKRKLSEPSTSLRSLNPITVGEIREAMRRYFSTNTMMSAFSSAYPPPLHKRLLCA